MSAKFIDGFDYLVAANLNLKWSVVSGSPTLGTGIYSKGKSITPGNSATSTLNASAASGMQGFHLFIGAAGFPVNSAFCSFNDTGTVQMDFRINAIGQIYCTRNGTTIGTTTTYQFVSNQWYWIEVQAIIDPAFGQAKMYVNATLVMSQTGLNNRATSNSSFNQVQIYTNGDSQILFDSYHYWDFTVGDSVTGFPYGEHIIDTQLANAVGSNTTWNRGGTNTGNNYSQVNEANEDGDTTYVYMSSSGAGDIDSYGWANLVESGTIGTIAINTISRIDDAGPHVYEHYALSSGSSGLSSGISPGASYINEQTFQGTDPNTGVAWTVAGRNAAQFGYKFIS